MSTSCASTIGDLLREARRGLTAAPFDAETREASLLLSQVLDRSEAAVLAYTEDLVAVDATRRFRRLLARRLSGEPVAYLFGEREFYGRPFYVDSRVLIPRPETEHLIEAVLALQRPARPRIVDIGSGSGCIAVTLALEMPDARLLATDLSLDALSVARSNVRRHGVEGRVALAASDVTSALHLERFDLVVSNPPYVDFGAAEQISPEVRDFEPHMALFAPDHGRSVLRRLIDRCEAMSGGAHLIVEIGYDQSDWIERTVAQRPAWRLVDVVKDYAAIPRTVVLRRATVNRRADAP